MCPGQGPCAILLPCLNKASLKDMGIWVFSHFQWPRSDKQSNIPLLPLIIKDCHACLTTWGALSVLLSLFWMLMCNQPHQRMLWPNYRGYEPCPLAVSSGSSVSQKLDHTFPSTTLLYCIILNTHHCSPGDSPELTYELSNVTVDDCLIIILSKTGAVHLFTFSAMLICSLVYKAAVKGQHMSSVFRFWTFTLFKYWQRSFILHIGRCKASI